MRGWRTAGISLSLTAAAALLCATSGVAREGTGNGGGFGGGAPGGHNRQFSVDALPLLPENPALAVVPGVLLEATRSCLVQSYLFELMGEHGITASPAPGGGAALAFRTRALDYDYNETASEDDDGTSGPRFALLPHGTFQTGGKPGSFDSEINTYNAILGSPRANVYANIHLSGPAMGPQPDGPTEDFLPVMAYKSSANGRLGGLYVMVDSIFVAGMIDGDGLPATPDGAYVDCLRKQVRARLSR